MANSAAGLFRATGKKPKPTVQMNLDGELERVEGGLPRAKEDWYPTPPEPTRVFLHAELARLRALGTETVWESSSGDGAMAREIEAAGMPVYRSDVVDRGDGAVIRDYYDFTEWPVSGGPRVTIGNPPYDQINWRDGKGRWLTHTMDVLQADYAAFLLSWSWMGAGGLRGIWTRLPPARVYLMAFKIDFSGQGSPPNLNCWVVWERGFKGDPALKMLYRNADARQLEL